MPQMHLPFFPDGVEHITSELAFQKFYLYLIVYLLLLSFKQQCA